MMKMTNFRHKTANMRQPRHLPRLDFIFPYSIGAFDNAVPRDLLATLKFTSENVSLTRAICNEEGWRTYPRYK